LFPKIAVFPLLPKHIHALSRASGPQRLCDERCETFLSSTGNFSSAWFRYLVPLRVRGKLVGAFMLGDRDEGAGYSPELLKLIGESRSADWSCYSQPSAHDVVAGAHGGEPAADHLRPLILGRGPGGLCRHYRCQACPHARPLPARRTLLRSHCRSPGPCSYRAG